MTSARCQILRSRLKTPREHGQSLIEPPWDDIDALIDENARLRTESPGYDLQGRSLADVSALARTELIEAARLWTRTYRDIATDEGSASGLVFLAGHQPQMFHPGVWFKNFVLGHLAKRHEATAVNLVVDTDVLADASLRVPGASVDDPHAEPVPFDRPGPGVPFEVRTIEDRDLFASFGRRAADELRPLVADPLLEHYWPLVQARAHESNNLGACLAQARHQLEGQWGLDTLEVPLSLACAGNAFAQFAAHLLSHAPRFRDAYNDSLHEYRRLHRLRSDSHPAPDLADEDGWTETPFWVWTDDNHRRRRLFAKQKPNEILLSDRQSLERRLSLGPETGLANAVEQLARLRTTGVQIRPRALITTLWARLALGDLFIHGIGGAKYDCVTGQLIERFFGLAPPRFLVVSATLHLPIERDRVTPDDVRSLEHDLRGLTYHPERYLSDTIANPDAARLIADKKRWIATPTTIENAKQRCQAIRRTNESLQPQLAAQRAQLSARLTAASHKLKAEGVLASREYAFCLYPETTLHDFLRKQLP